MNKLKAAGTIAAALTAIIGFFTTVWNGFAPKDPIVIELHNSEAANVAKPALAPTSVAATPPEPEADAIHPAATASAPDTHTLPPVPQLQPEQRHEPASGWTPEKALRIKENTAQTVCPDNQQLVFSVAKQGTRPDSAIYVTAPKASGRIEVGTAFGLSEQCRLILDRTGKTSSYFAEFTFIGTDTE